MSQKKSLSLEEFKEALSSDATKRAEAQETTIKELHAELGMKSKEIAERKEMCRVLFNRCFATCKGMMCVFCGIKDACKKERTVGKGVKDVDG